MKNLAAQKSNVRRRAGTVAVIAALGLSPILVDVPPAAAAPQHQVASAPQRLNIGGVYDARTFANYRTTDGAALTDRVIRSGDLQNLTNAGLAELQQRKVTTIVDLRTSFERSLKPNRVVPGARTVHADVMALAPLAGSADFPGMYRVFVDNPGAREAYRTTLLEVVKTVGRGDSIVVHCSAGRDRTGWASAVMLRIAGVDMATIEADFAAGNNGVDINWLRGAFQHATALYGSFDGYLKTGLRLNAEQVKQIRAAVRA